MGYKYPINNKTDLPEGWAMPDHMAKRVIDSVSKKPVSPEDELQKALDEIARDIALIEPDPQDWGWWVIHLLEQMEEKANRRGKRDEFEEMLKSLVQDLGKRISLA